MKIMLYFCNCKYGKKQNNNKLKFKNYEKSFYHYALRH